MVLDFIPRNIAAARRMLRYAPGIMLGSWDNEPERALVDAVTNISLIMREMIDTLEIGYTKEHSPVREKAYMEQLEPLHAQMRRALFAGANPNVYVSLHSSDFDESRGGKRGRMVEEAHPILRVAAHTLDPEAVRLLLKYGAKGNYPSVSGKEGNQLLHRSILLSVNNDVKEYTDRQPDVGELVNPRARKIVKLLEAYGAEEHRRIERMGFTGEEKGVVSPIEMVGVKSVDAPVFVTADRRVVGGGGSKGPSYTEIGYRERQRRLASAGLFGNNSALVSGLSEDERGRPVTGEMLALLLAEMKRELLTEVVNVVSQQLQDGLKAVEDRSQAATLVVVEEVLERLLKDAGVVKENGISSHLTDTAQRGSLSDTKERGPDGRQV